MWKKIFRSGEGKGIRVEKEKINWGKETEEEGEKKRKPYGVNHRHAYRSRQPFVQEFTASPVAYCDSQTSLGTVLDFYCESDL